MKNVLGNWNNEVSVQLISVEKRRSTYYWMKLIPIDVISKCIKVLDENVSKVKCAVHKKSVQLTKVLIRVNSCATNTLALERTIVWYGRIVADIKVFANKKTCNNQIKVFTYLREERFFFKLYTFLIVTEGIAAKVMKLRITSPILKISSSFVTVIENL